MHAKNGYFEIATWIHSLGFKSDIRVDDVFKQTCTKTNNVEIIKFFHSIGANVHIDDNCIFFSSCQNGYLEIAQWYHEIGVDVCSKNNSAFILACCDDKLVVAQWLHSLGADAHAQNNLVFNNKCSNDILVWLYNLYPDMLERNLFIIRENVLKKLDFSSSTLLLIRSISKKSKNKHGIPTFTDIDERVIHAICKNDMLDIYLKIRHQIPYVTLILEEGKIMDYTINKPQTKSARKK